MSLGRWTLLASIVCLATVTCVTRDKACTHQEPISRHETTGITLILIQTHCVIQQYQSDYQCNSRTIVGNMKLKLGFAGFRNFHVDALLTHPAANRGVWLTTLLLDLIDIISLLFIWQFGQSYVASWPWNEASNCCTSTEATLSVYGSIFKLSYHVFHVTCTKRQFVSCSCMFLWTCTVYTLAGAGSMAV